MYSLPEQESLLIFIEQSIPLPHPPPQTPSLCCFKPGSGREKFGLLSTLRSQAGNALIISSLTEESALHGISPSEDRLLYKKKIWCPPINTCRKSVTPTPTPPQPCCSACHRSPEGLVVTASSPLWECRVGWGPPRVGVWGSLHPGARYGPCDSSFCLFRKQGSLVLF